ncbi:MAG: class I SAM-dependent methyltransferase [Gammaproteobacteria bacterium]
MNLYSRYCLPCLLDWACGNTVFGRERAKVVPFARGSVLEVGFGSGRNLAYYDPEKVSLVWALEPLAGMQRIARRRIAQAPFSVEWIGLRGEEIPLEDGSVDTVLSTYTLCSIRDWSEALRQMRRVLKPSGRLIFCEHGLAPDDAVAIWQRRLTPLWSRITAGCHLDRPIAGQIESSGFSIESLESAYVPDLPKIGGYHYRGFARRSDQPVDAGFR